MDLRFEHEEYTPARDKSLSRESFITRAVLKSGLASTPERAQRVMLLVATALLVLAVIVIVSEQRPFFGPKPAVLVPPADGPGVPLP